MMIGKLEGLQFLAFYILANAVTLGLSGNVASAIKPATDIDPMKEVYKKHLLPKVPCLLMCGTSKADFESKKANLINDYQNFIKDGKSGNSEKLGFNEFLSLKLYTGPEYEIINQYLRKGKMPEKKDLSSAGQAKLGSWTEAMVREVVMDVKTGIKKIKKGESQLFRGTTFGAQVLSNGKNVEFGSLKPGDTYTEKGLLSTTVAREIGEAFAESLQNQYKSYPTLIILSSKENNGDFLAADLTKLSVFPGEKERLLPEGVKFMVVSVDDEVITSLDDWFYDGKFKVITEVKVKQVKTK